MTIAATAHPSIAVQALALLTGSSDEFQDLVGEANEADARDNHVYYLETDDRRSTDGGSMPHPRPRAIISDPTEAHQNVGTASWNTVGSLAWALEVPHPSAITGGDPDDLKDAAAWFGNLYGKIIEEMRDNIPAKPDQYLQARRIEKVIEPFLDEEEDTQEKFWIVQYRFEWFG